MPEFRPITFRTQIISGVVDFLAAHDMSCSETLMGLVDLIAQLAHYTEEGKSLFPEIYIIDSDKIFGAILPFQKYKLGEVAKTPDALKTALKKGAPLTESEWAIYILRKPTSFEFGVFRAGLSKISEPKRDALLEAGNNEMKVMLVHQFAQHTVEVIGWKNEGHHHVIHFGTHEDGPLREPLKPQRDCIALITENMPPALIDPAKVFLRGVFLEILQEQHGTLVAFISHRKRKIPPGLRDGTILENPIDLGPYILEIQSKKDLQSNRTLDGCHALLTGMMKSDGITLFTDNGKLLGYNIFIKYPKNIVRNTLGGARARTYDTLVGWLGGALVGAFMLSQDGKINFARQ